MNIAIVGTGLVGRVLALNLLKQGHSLTLYDKACKEGVTSAGFTAAGMLAPFAELETAESVIFDLGKKSLELWPDILDDIGMKNGLKQEGTIITAHPQDMSELGHFISTLRSKVDEAKDIKVLDSKVLSSLEPELGHHSKAYHIEKEGHIDAQKFIEFSTRYLSSCKEINWREYTAVTKLEANKIYTENANANENKSEEFDWVFDARGLGAKEYFEDLRGVRGEIFTLETKDINISRPTRFLHPRYSIYIVPREQDNSALKKESKSSLKRYIVGASQIESEDYSPVSVRSTLELLSAVFAVHPNFGEARVVNTKTNCRPAFKDNLPRIENEKGLTRINGLYRHGYLLAPAIVAQALKEGIYNDKY